MLAESRTRTWESETSIRLVGWAIYWSLMRSVCTCPFHEKAPPCQGSFRLPGINKFRPPARHPSIRTLCESIIRLGALWGPTGSGAAISWAVSSEKWSWRTKGQLAVTWTRRSSLVLQLPVAVVFPYYTGYGKGTHGHYFLERISIGGLSKLRIS